MVARPIFTPLPFQPIATSTTPLSIVTALFFSSCLRRVVSITVILSSKVLHPVTKPGSRHNQQVKLFQDSIKKANAISGFTDFR